MRHFLVAVLLVASAALADTAALLTKAEDSMRELEYGEALKSLEAAKKEPNNTREQMLRLYELQALTLATMGQDAKALKVFQALLSLTPDFKLKGNQPPRVTTTFFEARSWVDAKKPLAVRSGGATMGPGVVKDVKVEVTNDPLKLLKEVRFHLIIDGKPKDVDVAVAGTTVAALVSAPRVEWWAEGLAEKKGAVVAIGDASKPFKEASPDAPVVKPVEPPKVVKNDPPPKVEPEPKAAPIDAWSEPPPPSAPMSGLRLAGIGIGGAGVVAAGVGVVFGVLASGTAAKITGAEKDASGRIIGLTRVDALALDEQQKSQAALANVMMIGGGALAATGVTLIILGGSAPADPKVSLSPAPGGVSVFGQF